MKLRRRFEWRFGQQRLSAGERTLVAGSLNVAPEHQADRRDPLDADRGFAMAVEMEEAGADLLLIAAEPWLAGSRRIDDAEEMRRLVPVLKRLREKLVIPVGVTTDRSTVAARAFELGAEVIFDPTGLTLDPQLAKVVVQRDGGLIVGHTRGTPESWPKLPPWKEPVAGLLSDLDASLSRARRSGVKTESLLADPGLGFGKRREQNTEILAGLDSFERLDVPISTGLAELAAAPAATAAVLMGAHLVRVSEVRAIRVAVDLADALLLSAMLRAEKADTPDSNVSRVERRRPLR